MISACNSRHGPMYTHEHDNCVGRSIREYGEWSQNEIELILRYLDAGFVAVDVGANIGTHTIPMAKKIGPSGVVIAFEPQRLVFQILCANIVANDIPNAITHNMAVGNCCARAAADNLDFSVPGNHGGATVSNKIDDSKYLVSMVNIDSMNLPSCHLIKADIEGWETEMVIGAERTIKSCRPVLYLEWHDSKELVPLVKSMGYNVYIHETGSFNRDNFNKRKDDIFNGWIERNILCVPKEKDGGTNLPEA